MGSKGPLQKNFCVKKDFCVKKGPKKDYFSSLVLKRTKSLIKDLYASTKNVLRSLSIIYVGKQPINSATDEAYGLLFASIKEITVISAKTSSFLKD